MISKKLPLREVYVWELPVRIFHWVNAFCITFLVITGFLIAFPISITQGEGAQQIGYWFGYTRFAHLTLGIIFILNFLVRIYWFFAGNAYAKWNTYIPLTKRQWKGIIDTIKVDVFLLSPKPIYDIGHNSLAATTYFGIFILMIVQAVTGLAMWAPSSDYPGAEPLEGLLLQMGGFFIVRNLHYVVMWFFIFFVVAHVYLVFYHDYIERNGVASSIIGGWKFIDERLAKAHEDEEVATRRIEEDEEIIREIEREIKEGKKKKKKAHER
ncbi:MAG: Ni/Fe-hydrogenase, b-type cytochrome subunit [Bacteroidales bacterium]